MKHTELRIGNYVSYNGQIVQVTGVDSEFVYLNIVTFDYVKHDEVEPVPLTESILIDAGFRKTNEILYEGESTYHIGVIWIVGWEAIVGSDMSVCIEDGNFRQLKNVCEDNAYIESGIEIKYVHQLQNLYFALTGEELTLTTPPCES